ncbi:hypothetical protein SAMN05421874_102645 [Nonomuraea maritima]|uniref:Uncharacterized protein n=1 Tax=Nonomuraea maritima TaxID=683260 RepID=A0A1G8VM43_9ACTN|nr:hypothetical protein SAMN05421874_102645 [Nonomuraea maritima]
MSGGSGTRLRPAPHSDLPPTPGFPLPQGRPAPDSPRPDLNTDWEPAASWRPHSLSVAPTAPDLIVHEVRGAQMGSGARRVPVTRRGWGPRG